MAAKPKAKPPKTGVTGKSVHTKATSKLSESRSAASPAIHSSHPTCSPSAVVSTSVVGNDPAQRPNQPFQGAAPVRPIQQSPNLASQQPNQQHFSVPGVYPPQSGLQSPYLNNPSQFGQQHHHQAAAESPYYTANPSPRSTTSTSFYPTEKSDPMAAAATMQHPRAPYPPMYHTPQSNSPVSLASQTSPGAAHDSRSMFSQQPSQLSQTMYPYGYQSLNQMQSPYGTQHPNPMGNPQMMSNQYNPAQMSHSQVSSHPPNLNASPRLKSEQSQHYAQTPQQKNSIMGQPTPGQTPGSGSLPTMQSSGPPATSNAAPGPIPATTPLVVRQDNNGVQWIAFEYSRDRVKMEYTIRCDVESVDTNSLSQEFKSENCVYPRACVPRDQYKGNRLTYESDCNQVGWALAELNPCLRGKRGLIQRAVDSWRNSNQDPRLRSRRVRRQAKMSHKSRINTAVSQASATSVSAGLPGQSMPAPSRNPGSIPTPTSLHHHHSTQDVSPTGQDPQSATAYSTAHSIHRPNSTHQHLASPQELRHAHTFPGYQPYPTVPTSLGPSMAPPMQGSIHPYGRPGGNAAMASRDQQEREEEDTALFGDIPEGKRRKFILVDDTQKNARVRVKVTLDQISMSEIPDSYRKQNSVYPRSYYPVQMQAVQDIPRGRFVDDDGTEENEDGPPTIGKTTVPCTLLEGDAEVEVPQLTRGRRKREQMINELGYRMAWGQGRVFSNRPIFLGRALDAYRSKQRMALVGSGQETTAVPPHLELRPGKRRWQERTRPATRPNTPPPSMVG